jgi:hypothetical protein
MLYSLSKREGRAGPSHPRARHRTGKSLSVAKEGAPALVAWIRWFHTTGTIGFRRRQLGSASIFFWVATRPSPDQKPRLHLKELDATTASPISSS